MKETPNTRMLKGFFSIETKLRFTYLKPDFSNINDVYTNNITLWFFINSDYRKDNSEADTDGFQNNIVNNWINDLSKLEYIKTTKGFELTETDFIKAEFKRFELFEVDKLNLAEKKQFDFYTDFLNKKLNPLEDFTTDEVLKNPNETIFKDDFAFTLFDKMKQHYSDTKTPQADYSFLFDIMQNDGFVICTGKKFVGYLVEDFDIKMTKIDSFKTGNKQKTKLYIATKENLQKKHGLSTI